MKKLIALILMAGLLLTGTMVYAEETTSETTSTNREAKINALKDIKGEFKTQTDEIKANQEAFSKLRKEATELFKEAKQRVKELLKSEDDISQEQIDAIKQSIDILVEDKKLLVETKGDILKETVDLRAARRSKDTEAYKAALEDIISIQESRIDALNKVIEDLKGIGAI